MNELRNEFNQYNEKRKKEIKLLNQETKRHLIKTILDVKNELSIYKDFQRKCACFKCNSNLECQYAFDLYNVNVIPHGDCLATK